MVSEKESPFQKKAVPRIYSCLLNAYGPQGWWPLTDLHAGCGANPTKTGSLRGYHPGDYSYPKTKNQQFEIICGALLTQNTSWPQAETALLLLKSLNALSPQGVLALDMDTLKGAVKPASYYNQKAERLKTLAGWFLSIPGKSHRGDLNEPEENEKTMQGETARSRFLEVALTGAPSREELLSLKGVGPETADSILLYAFKQPCFVIDAYTRRIMGNLGLIEEAAKYDEIKALFEENLPGKVSVYQEYHALLVEHAKRFYQKKRMDGKCQLLKLVWD